MTGGECGACHAHWPFSFPFSAPLRSRLASTITANEKFAALASCCKGGPFASGGASVAYRIVLSAQATPHACCCRHHCPRGAGARDEFGPRLARFLFQRRPEAAAPDLVFRRRFQQ